MVVTGLREAGDVAVHSLRTPFEDAFDLLRTGHRRARGVDHHVGWQVVNLDLGGVDCATGSLTTSDRRDAQALARRCGR